MASAETETALRTAVVRADAVSKRYGAGGAATLAVRDVSLQIEPGEFVALMGRSGCGKTTLLNLLGAMDLPTRGHVWLAGQDTSALADDALTALRRRSVGFVFQAFHLLPTLTVEENITVPLRLAGQPAGSRVLELADRLGIASRLAAYPHQLSGGEAQRAALARALIHRPALIIADEPTGNLDTQAAATVIDLLGRLSREQNAAVVMATHSPEAAAHAGRTLHMRDGELIAAQ
ncbi:MAG: ABC transporter ATP-binding protein [Acidobacteria bacterium]|nr:MAG: ABC transporter ATP-binding protein [Acidobacteriota bacterium]